jgi:hypothetical protein
VTANHRGFLGINMLSINNLPLWAKSLLAPATMLVAMIALAGIVFVYLSRQETSVAELNDVAFEDLRQSMLATEAVTGFQTDLYHLTSTAANETDKPKIEAIAVKLEARLGSIASKSSSSPAAAQIRPSGKSSPTTTRRSGRSSTTPNSTRLMAS